MRRNGWKKKNRKSLKQKQWNSKSYQEKSENKAEDIIVPLFSHIMNTESTLVSPEKKKNDLIEQIFLFRGKKAKGIHNYGMASA